MNEKLSQIRKDVNEFKVKNHEKYEVINKLLDYIDHLTEELYPETIQLIKANKNIFFKDHSSAILFYSLIIHSCYINFKKFELNLNIIVDFSNEIKNAKTTENELIQISLFYFKSINYLYSKQFFSIDSIIEQSTSLIFLFIYFWPEIDQNDHEYTQIREKDPYLNSDDPQNQREIEFFKKIKENPEKHILNRKNGYHPSSLHKSIREDDIETFQSIISKNNINFNYIIEYSYYERTPFFQEDLTLIQIAAFYGSIKIFKFLMIQNENINKENLLEYSYFGRNYEIIHLCEKEYKFSEKVYLQAIKTHQNDLLSYYIDNFGDQITEDEDVENLLSDFVYEEKEVSNDENECYKYLNYESLIVASESHNYKIILNCLEKIVFIAKNYELVEDDDDYVNESSFLDSLEFDFDLFKFIYSQKKKSVDKFRCSCYFENLNDCLDFNMNDAFKFVFFDLKEKINSYSIFQYCIINDHDIANFFLDLQIDKNMNERSMFEELNAQIKVDDFKLAIKYYNENIVVKMIKLYNVFKSDDDMNIFAMSLKDLLSKKMINSLIDKISEILSEKQFSYISSLLKENY